MKDSQITIEVSGSEWESFETWKGKEVADHKIKAGSVIEVQLALEPRHLIRYWIVGPNRQRQGTLDPQYDALLALNLGPGANDVGSVIQPLRKGASLVYLEGRVAKVARIQSKVDEKIEYVNALLDCELPIILEEEIVKNYGAPIIGSEGDGLIAICRLAGMIASPNTLFRAPLKAQVISTSVLNTRPKIVLLTIEPRSYDSLAENQLFYSRIGGSQFT